MKFINKAKFLARVHERFHPESESWLYNYFPSVFRSHSYAISSRAKVETLIKKTQKLVPALGSNYPLYAFPDGIAGWRDTPKNRRLSPIELSDQEELRDTIENRIYFRDPKRREDNYHITDADFRWVVVFTHHGDWHLYAPPALLVIAKPV